MRVRNADGAPRFYETSGSPSSFVGKVTKILTEFGSSSFMVENVEGVPVGIAFSLDGLAYRLRPNVEGVRARLEGARRKGKASAETVAWAQAFALLEMQLEAIENGGRAGEVLGGYVMLDTGETVGERIEERTPELVSGARLLLPAWGGA